MAEDIEKLRREIDGVDDELLALLNRRADLARRIGALKGASPAYRPERETEILRSLAKRNTGPLPSERAAAVFSSLLSAMNCASAASVLAPRMPSIGLAS